MTIYTNDSYIILVDTHQSRTENNKELIEVVYFLSYMLTFQNKDGDTLGF